MIQQFKRGDIIKSFRVENNKVFTTITLKEFKITNPTIEQFINSGWEEYTFPEIIPEPYIPSLEELVEQKIRERYSINQEFEVQRKRDVEQEAFEEYYNFVENCITSAKQELGLL